MTEYKVVRADSHSELERVLNELHRENGWELAHYATWSTIIAAAHFAVLTRDTGPARA